MFCDNSGIFFMVQMSEKIEFFLDILTLKMRPLNWLETFATKYPVIQCYIPEECILKLIHITVRTETNPEQLFCIFGFNLLISLILA